MGAATVLAVAPVLDLGFRRTLNFCDAGTNLWHEWPPIFGVSHACTHERRSRRRSKRTKTSPLVSVQPCTTSERQFTTPHLLVSTHEALASWCLRLLSRGLPRVEHDGALGHDGSHVVDLGVRAVENFIRDGSSRGECPKHLLLHITLTVVPVGLHQVLMVIAAAVHLLPHVSNMCDVWRCTLLGVEQHVVPHTNDVSRRQPYPLRSSDAWTKTHGIRLQTARTPAAWHHRNSDAPHYTL